MHNAYSRLNNNEKLITLFVEHMGHNITVKQTSLCSVSDNVYVDDA